MWMKTGIHNKGFAIRLALKGGIGIKNGKIDSQLWQILSFENGCEKNGSNPLMPSNNIVCLFSFFALVWTIGERVVYNSSKRKQGSDYVFAGAGSEFGHQEGEESLK